MALETFLRHNEACPFQHASLPNVTHALEYILLTQTSFAVAGILFMSRVGDAFRGRLKAFDLI